jgi:hypothetical protein
VIRNWCMTTVVKNVKVGDISDDFRLINIIFY